ncbi:hypothetical protein [Pantoea sp. 18069]|uniref:hypothetical protein n=1 Tax=Pantoea sp. 18069 TaxID=2681415 RepID=UPI00135C6321|nr:hypothetical protein [Pantoea sp. 18069]
MSEAKHTPGPWFQSHRKAIVGYSTEVYTANGEVIATVAWYPRRLNETTTVTDREANARLIAVAPELLEALQGLEREGWLSHIVAACKKESADASLYASVTVARAAIAKATE